MMNLRTIPFTLAYIAAIPLVNVLFHALPVYHVTTDTIFTPASIIAGLVYVLRDFAQRELGRKNILMAMALAATISYLVGNPAFVAASITAFFAGELVDWAVFTYSRRPLSQRLVISNAISLPIDILVILIGLNYSLPGVLPISPQQFLVMFFVNMSTAVLIFPIVRHFEKAGYLRLT